MEEGIFVRWLKQPGQWVEAGEAVFILETDKATQDVEAIDAGTLHIAADAPQPGERVLVGRVIGALLAKGESPPAYTTRAISAATPRASADVSTASSPLASGLSPRACPPGATAGLPSSAVSEVTQRVAPAAVNNARPATPAMRRALREQEHRAQRAQQQQTAAPARQQAPTQTSARKRPTITPRARRAARDLGIATDQLAGTGRGGRIRERDVRQAATNGSRHSIGASSGATAGLPSSAAVMRPASEVSAPSTNIRAAIARRLVAGLHAMAPVTLTTRADATNLVNLRAQFQATADEATPVPSLTDIIVKLTALALERHPLLNARWQDDRVVENNTIAIGLAVDCEAGLFVPVLHDVPALGLRDIAVRSRELIEKARGRRLSSADLEGGTFTVSNLGMFGIDAFTPIINPPQAAVLGIGAIRREPVYQPDGSLAPRELTTLSLTFDHRVVDGAPAARFLQTLVTAIENPAAWLTT
jgi:pyruvate dehydrogenase E2 component (dihydrolipoamide acetyltransferase)